MGKPPGNTGYWGFLPSRAPGAAVARIARQHEEAGLRGSLAVQLHGPPWIPLAAAATSTERTLLGANVALAFVRSPFETACAAIDLDHLSQGRVVLGLGPSVRTTSEDVFGSPGYRRPVARLREAGLERAGRRREDLHVCVELFVTPNHDPAESIEDARAVTAFYAGIEQSESYYAAHGFAEEARRLQAGIERGDHRSVAHLVPDEMASTFVVTGTPDEVRRKVEHVWNVADSVALAPPAFALPREKARYYASTIADTFYT